MSAEGPGELKATTWVAEDESPFPWVGHTRGTQASTPFPWVLCVWTLYLFCCAFRVERGRSSTICRVLGVTLQEIPSCAHHVLVRLVVFLVVFLTAPYFEKGSRSL